MPLYRFCFLRLFFFSNFFLSVFALSVALFLEYMLGYKPCYLCVYERVPYIAACVFSFIAIFSKYKRAIIYVLFCTWLISSGIAGYHVMIERGMVEPTHKCSYKIVDESVFDWDAAPVFTSDCSIPLYTPIGISFTEINFIASVLLLLYSAINIIYFRNVYKKNAKT